MWCMLTNNSMLRRPQYVPISLLIFLFAIPILHARESINITVNPDVEINVDVFPATAHPGETKPADLLFIWQPHEKGLQSIDTQLAERLAAMGIEVWLQDLLQAYFLSNTASNMSKLNGDGFNRLITEAHKTNKTIVVGGSGRGIVPVLRGIRDWQLANNEQSKFSGAILLSPKFYTQTPEPGTQPELLPIVKATNSKLFILQPDKSPYFWQLKLSLNALQQSGSDVFLKPMRGIRDRFYFRPDAFNKELNASDDLANNLFDAIILLASMQDANRQAVKKLSETKTIAQKQKERTLEKYLGNPKPQALNLPKLNGEQLDLKSLKGNVVVVNFWATWCPPCVHEMPSMQRLNNHFDKKPFTLLGVNMAESNEEVSAFLTNKVNINFSIVMDYDGQALKDWGVFAFPTSYVIDKQGKIRYALFGSVEWDNPDIVSKIEQLIAE